MTHPGGRPREYNIPLLADQLIEWAKQSDSINLNKFCCTREPPIPPSYLTRWANESDQFCEALSIAKAFIGARREEMLSSETLHVKAYDLNAAVYDYFLKQEKREQAQFESDLKKAELDTQSEQYQQANAKLDKVLDQFSALQSDRKISESNAINDQKS